MKLADAITLLETVLSTQVPRTDKYAGEWYDEERAEFFVTRGATVLQAIFPESHAVRKAWDGLIVKGGQHAEVSTVDRARAVLRAALASAKAGELSTIYDGVRADTVSEVLDQAEGLLAGNYTVAATVLAGGALETHLLHLCTRNGLTWRDAGSISKYDGAIAKARNHGTEIYSTGDTKLVVAWGDQRNEAAHDPTNYKRTVPEVRLMIDGIRQFIGRNP